MVLQRPLILLKPPPPFLFQKDQLTQEWGSLFAQTCTQGLMASTLFISFFCKKTQSDPLWFFFVFLASGKCRNKYSPKTHKYAWIHTPFGFGLS